MKRGKRSLEPAPPSKSGILNEIKSTESIDEIIMYTRSPDPQIRLTAVKQICPCKTKSDIDEFWDRMIQLTKDEDWRVREQVLHNLCDGSPPEMESRVMEVVEKLKSDPVNQVRKKANKVIASYIRTGKWNVL